MGARAGVTGVRKGGLGHTWRCHEDRGKRRSQQRRPHSHLGEVYGEGLGQDFGGGETLQLVGVATMTRPCEGGQSPQDRTWCGCGCGLVRWCKCKWMKMGGVRVRVQWCKLREREKCACAAAPCATAASAAACAGQNCGGRSVGDGGGSSNRINIGRRKQYDAVIIGIGD